MIIEIKIPSPGESISEVEIASWLVSNGAYVEKDQEVAEIESDKATLPLIAEKSGELKILIEEGTTAKVGAIACTIDTSIDAPEGTLQNPKATTAPKSSAENTSTDKKSDSVTSSTSKQVDTEIQNDKAKSTPLAKKLMEENNLNIDDVIAGLKKISKNDVQRLVDYKPNADEKPIVKGSRELKEEKMTPLRKKISQRLVAVKNETAMLTTFNEVDMSAIMEMRKKYQKKFVDKHGIKLGFMSFFTKAVTIALRQFPKINSYIDGENIIVPEYYDVGIAVQTNKGLMVPVLRNAETMSLADIEKYIIELAGRARKFRLTPDEMTGGTFTITNGGIFGSLLSTPILNPPQSGILGMHNIVERPIAENGQVVIRPMMYVALSYDHRIVDGRDSVSFLVKAKELLEAPHKLLIEDGSAEQKLLEL